MILIDLAERGYIPDRLVRLGIRTLLRRRLTCERRSQAAASTDAAVQFAEQLRTSPLAIATDEANLQHYEVPADFFQQMLGPRLKYSACYFADSHTSLADAEEEMLRRSCDHAGIEDGQQILELGCGWGSLTLWLAAHYPKCRITAVSNSASQREFIERRAAAERLSNIHVITADMRTFEIDMTFDRVVSVEMFEHMRNYELLFHKVAGWLKPGGLAFVHVFCHRDRPYLFETEGAANWMGRHFFTGGTMPSEQLFDQFTDDLTIQQQWRINGLHYWRTCEAWLKNVDRNREAILERFSHDLSPQDARRNLQRWRIFLMACAELFRFRQGEEWFVAHYRFQRTEIPREAGPRLRTSRSSASLAGTAGS